MWNRFAPMEPTHDDDVREPHADSVAVVTVVVAVVVAVAAVDNVVTAPPSSTTGVQEKDWPVVRVLEQRSSDGLTSRSRRGFEGLRRERDEERIGGGGPIRSKVK